MLVRGVTLEGAWLGIEFYLYPDWSRLTDATVSAAHSYLRYHTHAARFLQQNRNTVYHAAFTFTRMPDLRGGRETECPGLPSTKRLPLNRCFFLAPGS